LLAAVHPHYHRQPEYRYLQVLTQSCDLERRGGGPCKARYISVAAVRPLRTALEREVDNVRRSSIESAGHFADESRRNTIIQFVERLLNNNDPAYFYLHADLDAGLPEAHCTFLRLSIAVRSRDHFESCLAAKFLQLRPEFQAKLGWLVGNLYSRVGTSDWSNVEPDAVFDKRVSDLVESIATWIPRRIFDKVVKELQGRAGPIPIEDVRQAIEKYRKRSRKDDALDAIRAIAAGEIAEEHLDRFILRIRNDPTVAAALRD
jgi:hypothetical protein